MPLALDRIQRGALCLAYYPFTVGFPLTLASQHESELLADLEKAETVEDISRQVGQANVIATVKFRRVLVLQDGTNASRHDVSVARVHSIGATMRSKRSWYDRVRSGQHPVHVHISPTEEHGTAVEEYVDALHVQPIAKNMLLKRVGQLTGLEMRAVSRCLVGALEIDTR